MAYKKINLFLVAVAFVIIFFTIPAYNTWINTKIFGDNIDYQISHMGVEDRRTSRYGYPYVVYQNVSHKVTDPKHAIILMPPNDYLKTLNVKQFVTPEPATFYYYTGLICVLPNSPNADSANWELLVNSDQQIMLRKITSKGHLDTLLAFYRKYKQI
jgi:hypothetical protein